MQGIFNWENTKHSTQHPWQKNILFVSDIRQKHDETELSVGLYNPFAGATEELRRTPQKAILVYLAGELRQTPQKAILVYLTG